MQNSPKDFFLDTPMLPFSPSLLCALLYHTPSTLVLLAYQGINFIQLGESYYRPEAAAHTKLRAGNEQCPKGSIIVLCSLEYRGEGSSGEGCSGARCSRLAHPQHARLERDKVSICMKTHGPRHYIGSHLTEPHQRCSMPVIHSS